MANELSDVHRDHPCKQYLTPPAWELINYLLNFSNFANILRQLC